MSHNFNFNDFLFSFMMNEKHDEIVPRETVTSEEIDAFVEHKMENYNDIIKMLKEMPQGN